MPEAPIIEIVGASKYFANGRERFPAIDNLSIKIAAHGITGLVGPDGAGKTTLLRLMAGLLRPDSGRVAIFGRDSIDGITEMRPRIGYMPQRFGLYEDLTVSENLRLFGDLHLLAADRFTARQSELMQFTGLSDFGDRLAGKLSGGMKQKLGLACALISQPALLLLDEPSVGVDPISRRELWRLVETLTGGGTTVVWSTAYLEEAEKCGDVIILDAGRILAAGRPAQLIEEARTRAWLMPVKAAQRREMQRDLLKQSAIRDATLSGDNIRVVLDDGDTGAALSHQKATSSRLEDAVISLLRRGSRPQMLNLEVAPGPEGRQRRDDGTVIAAAGLSRRFGNFTAVNNVAFQVKRGEIFGLLGPNGAGKSTIFRMLCGLLAPSGGTATVAGVDIGSASADARQRIGYMAQRFSLYGDLSVRENLRFMAGVYGLGRQRFATRLAWACDAFDLGDHLNTKCTALSLGHKQRLSLAAAVLHDPDVLFLDEPTSGVDPLARRQFWLRVGLFIDAGMTVLVTSHFMDEAENCDRIAVIDHGELLVLDTPSALRNRCITRENPEPTLDDAFVYAIAHPKAGAPA